MRSHLPLLLAGACLFAQDLQEPLRVSVALVQVDAVVTDGKGRHVDDLTRDDFELLQDGRHQKITHFSYVRTGGPRPAVATGPSPKTRGVAPPSSVRLQREKVQRTVALVADDLGLSFESVHRARQAMRKFVDEQMQPEDMVAILRTSRGMGALQQFTNDKRLLHAAIDRIQWNMDARTIPSDGGSPQRTAPRNTLYAIRYIVHGLRGMPGRKCLIVLSDGFKLPRLDGFVGKSLRDVTDDANRGAVVIYSIDTRGVEYLGLRAEDDTQGMEEEEVREMLDARRDNSRANQDGLRLLAAMTGGLAQLNNNDLNAGIVRAVEDQSGYYLIGFNPGEEAFERIKGEGKYHRLKLRVTRPGLAVRHRMGYVGEERTAPAQPSESLVAALQSPFASAAVRLRLTSLFGNSAKEGSYVQALLHIDGRDLKFEPAGDGWSKTTLDIVAMTRGEGAAPADKTLRAYTIRTKGETAEQIRKTGLVYNLRHTVKKPGPYHLRVAVRDSASGLVGSASQFVEIPDLRKQRLALSGIMMFGGDVRAAGAHETVLEQEGAVGPENLMANPAMRVFRTGKPFSYAVVVYNARWNGARVADVLLQARLFRDGRQVWEDRPFPLVLAKDANPMRAPGGGMILLGDKTSPGEYFLQVTATRTGQSKEPPVTQWIDMDLR